MFHLMKLSSWQVESATYCCAKHEATWDKIGENTREIKINFSLFCETFPDNRHEFNDKLWDKDVWEFCIFQICGWKVWKKINATSKRQFIKWMKNVLDTKKKKAFKDSPKHLCRGWIFIFNDVFSSTLKTFIICSLKSPTI